MAIIREHRDVHWGNCLLLWSFSSFVDFDWIQYIVKQFEGLILGSSFCCERTSVLRLAISGVVKNDNIKLFGDRRIHSMSSCAASIVAADRLCLSLYCSSGSRRIHFTWKTRTWRTLSARAAWLAWSCRPDVAGFCSAVCLCVCACVFVACLCMYGVVNKGWRW